MADWSHPLLSDSYSSILTTHLTGRDLDAITLCNTDPTNAPEHAIKYLRSSNKFQERIGGAWIDLALAIAGGGTGANSAASARTNLGLGTLATQNANSVAITGGIISGVTISGDGSGLTGLTFQNKTTSTGTQTTLTTLFADILSLAVTPRNNSNRIRIDASVNCRIQPTIASAFNSGQIDLIINRNTTLIQEFDGALSLSSSVGSAGTTIAIGQGGNIYISVFDSPATTSSVTYTVRARVSAVTNITGYINYSSLGTPGSRMNLQEIGPT